jgi:YggT family protein
MRIIIHLVSIALQLYLWVVIVRAVLSWLRPNPYNPIVRFVCRLVDPVTYRISRIVPTRIGAVDIAPMILIVLIVLARGFVSRVLVQSLYF